MFFPINNKIYIEFITGERIAITGYIPLSPKINLIHKDAIVMYMYDNKLYSKYDGKTLEDKDGGKWTFNGNQFSYKKGSQNVRYTIANNYCLWLSLNGWDTYDTTGVTASSINIISFNIMEYVNWNPTSYGDFITLFGYDISSLYPFDTMNVKYPRISTANIIENGDLILYAGYKTWAQYLGSSPGLGGGTFNINNYFSKSIIIETPDTDPFAPGGDSKPGGGDGDFNKDSDPVGVPALPSISAVASDFVQVFTPSVDELKTLKDYLWSDLFDIATLKKLYANPMDCIIGLQIVPVDCSSPIQREVTVGNRPTGINLTVAGKQYYEVDCGSYTLKEYWGSYLDYSPYTQVSIALPYIGIHALDTDDVMGETIQVVYHVDILSGACIAFIKCGQSVLYEFGGNCATQIPITQNDMSQVLQSVAGLAFAIGSTALSGGLAAPMAETAGGAMLASSSANVLTSKPHVEKSGAIGGSAAVMGIQRPYLIINRPNQALPKGQNTFMGYPTYVTSELSKCKGFTTVDHIHITGVPGTDGELQELEALLKEGVII